MTAKSNLVINPQRLWDSLMETAKYGGTAKGGIKRLTVSDDDKRVRDWFKAQCEALGIEREVSLFMMQGEDVAEGDHVLVHVGYAIQKVSEEEARLTWELFDEIVAHA